MINKNSTVKIGNLVVNHGSRPVKLNTAFYFLRYAHVRYVKSLLTNIQKQQNLSEISLLFQKSYKPKARIAFSASWLSGNYKYLCFFVYSESHSTSKPCRIQQTFMMEFSYMFFLLVLQFHAVEVLKLAFLPWLIKYLQLRVTKSNFPKLPVEEPNWVSFHQSAPSNHSNDGYN